jgi:hypothetical protein
VSRYWPFILTLITSEPTEYFEEEEEGHERVSLREFLDSLRNERTKNGYLAPLSQSTRLFAAKAFYQKWAATLDMSVDEVIRYEKILLNMDSSNSE